MKHLFIFILLFGLNTQVTAGDQQSSNQQLEAYISGFNYEAKKEMKMNSKALIRSLMEGKAQLIEIRFNENMPHGKWGLQKIYL